MRLRSRHPPIDVKLLFTLVFKEACAARASDENGRGCLAINSVTELCNRNEKLNAFLEEMILGNINRIETIIKWGVESKELPRDLDTHGLALSLKALLVGLNVMCKAVREESELWLAAKTTLTALNMYEELPTAS